MAAHSSGGCAGDPWSELQPGESVTLGMTWFMTGHSKFQFDWIHAFLNNSAKGFSSADLFVTRIQVDF